MCPEALRYGSHSFYPAKSPYPPFIAGKVRRSETDVLPLSYSNQLNVCVVLLIVVQLNTGSHLQSVSEDMQVMWFEVEHHLNQIISENLAAESNIDSAGQSVSVSHLPQ